MCHLAEVAHDLNGLRILTLESGKPGAESKGGTRSYPLKMHSGSRKFALFCNGSFQAMQHAQLPAWSVVHCCIYCK